MRPTPAGRGGTARCCSPYNAILERLDTMDVRIQQAVDDANAAMSAAVIQAGNAAQSASDALTQAGIAAGKASDAAADAADAAQDAADAAQALSDINDTIQTTLDNELGGKVDKLTTAGLHLYSHTGSTQSEEEPIDGTTANSIPIRDGNGRMQAADPASGATDKTLVTANWVSQTGDSAPNNLMHRTSNETIYGFKSMTNGVEAAKMISADTTPYTWYKVAVMYATKCARMTYQIAFPYNNRRYMVMDAVAITPRTQNSTALELVKTMQVKSSDLSETEYLGIAYDPNDSNFYLFIKAGQFTHHTLIINSVTSAAVLSNANDFITPITPVADDPTTYSTYRVI